MPVLSHPEEPSSWVTTPGFVTAPSNAILPLVVLLPALHGMQVPLCNPKTEREGSKK